MSAERPSTPAYDRIAHLYDVDMAQNMRFADVDFYARISERKGGRVLELGCGNGRILLQLLARGIDIAGIDSSPKMLVDLVRKAAIRGLHAPVCVMDVRHLGFAARFDVVLCPYSLVTYMTAEQDAVRMLDEVKDVLAPNGIVVVDAFISRPIDRSDLFSRDYVRPFGAGSLVRSKRITALSERVNRIERRYEVLSPDGKVEERIETCEDIRVYTPAELLSLASACGLCACESWWNYASPNEIDDAQFFTIVAERST